MSVSNVLPDCNGVPIVDVLFRGAFFVIISVKSMIFKEFVTDAVDYLRLSNSDYIDFLSRTIYEDSDD